MRMIGPKKAVPSKIPSENLADLNVTNVEEVSATSEPVVHKLKEVFEDPTALEHTLRYQFKDRNLYARALTHRSALSLEERSDYERLEFLGDAVLGLGIAHLLIEKYPEAKEGDLSKMRAALVNAQSLASIARTLGVGPFIRVGRSEATAGGQDRPSILADVFEALLGAIYLDGGFTEAFSVINQVFSSALGAVQTSDPKSELQELLHAMGSEPPQYLLELVEGPDHAPTFVTVVVIDSVIAGRGRGSTKKAAQQAAAAEALEKLIPTSQAGSDPTNSIDDKFQAKTISKRENII